MTIIYVTFNHYVYYVIRAKQTYIFLFYDSYYMSNNKNDIISKIYYDPSGYGSIQNTWTDAHEQDPSIKTK